MRLFGKRNDELEGLEHELRRRRPQPRAEFLEQNVSRIQASEPRRFALRSRVSVAVATTALLCVVAGTTGGLGYASAATSHTMRAFVHVFGSSSSERRSAPTQQFVAQQHVASVHANVQAATAPQASSIGANASAIAHNAVSNALQTREVTNPASNVYVVFVFVCLRVPPQSPFVFITLRLPPPAADRLIARGLATPGPC